MSWVSPKVKTGRSGVEGGRGAFAREKIKKGEILTVYGGYIMNRKQFDRLPEELKEFPYHVTDNLLFGPLSKKDVGAGEMFNHSCEPNAGFKETIKLAAMRDIGKGEEITFDYAVCMTSSILNFKCLCGKKNCRGTIKGSDWKKEYLQKKYKGYFMPYIQEKIDRLKK